MTHPTLFILYICHVALFGIPNPFHLNKILPNTRLLYCILGHYDLSSVFLYIVYIVVLLIMPHPILFLWIKYYQIQGCYFGTLWLIQLKKYIVHMLCCALCHTQYFSFEYNITKYKVIILGILRHIQSFSNSRCMSCRAFWYTISLSFK